MTFELPDNEQMCFHEVIDKGIKCVLEFQVIQGGNYDVDLTLKSPHGATLYAEQKKQYDRYEWTTDEHGEYRFCFSNEFSTFTHKLVYFDFQVGDEESLRIGSSSSPLTAMTQMETSVLNVHQSLKVVIDYQTHHRLRESQGRSFAEDLNEQVNMWSVGQTIVIIIASIGQILILRSFFSERKPYGGARLAHS
jgi:protein ERP2